jgi:hypothetical protein
MKAFTVEAMRTAICFVSPIFGDHVRAEYPVRLRR